MRFFIVLLIIYILFSLNLHAQNETANWVIGNYNYPETEQLNFISIAGNHIKTNDSFNPQTRLDILNQIFYQPYHNTSSYSDSTGVLKFYLKNRIRNIDHDLMRGQFLDSQYVNTRSMIVQLPGSDSLFYVFSVYTRGWWNHALLTLQIIDLSLNGGKGEVIEIHTLFSGRHTPEFTLLMHSNKKDFWFICYNTNEHFFNSYLINENGLQDPVRSNEKINFTELQPATPQFYYKTSPDGTKIAVGISSLSHTYRFYLMDFDPKSGLISNGLILKSPGAYNLYDFEFSPDSRKLYYSGLKEIFQLDISSGDSAQIVQSVKKIKHCPNTYTHKLQLAQNGKIYTSEAAISPWAHDSFRLGVIHAPNENGAACEWQENARVLETGQMVFPSFVSQYLQPPFSFQNTCYGNNTIFHLTDSSVVNAHWNFDDPNSGNNIVSNSLNPTHLFETPGDHYVTCTLFYENGQSKILGSNIRIKKQVEPFSLGADTVLCEGDTLNIQPCIPAVSYLWQDGSQSSSYTVFSSDTVILRIQNSCNYYEDTMIIEFQNKPSINIGGDTAICFDQLPIQIEAPLIHNAEYLWSSGDTARHTSLTESGVHIVEVAIGTCKAKDSILLDISFVYPDIDFTSDTSLCNGDTLVLNVYDEGSEYLWHNGSKNHSYMVTTTEFVKVESNIGACRSKDSLNVIFKEMPAVNLGPDTTICQGDTLRINTVNAEAGYLWQDGSTNAFYRIFSKGIYHVKVESDGCINQDTIKVSIFQKPYAIADNYTICLGDTISFIQEGVSFLWSDGNIQPYYIFNKDETLSLTRENICGTTNDTLNFDVEVYPWIEILGNHKACYGDTVQLSSKSNTPIVWGNGSTNEVIQITETGNYSVTATNICGTESKSHFVNFDFCCKEPLLPNLITPNGDNLNDYFYFECAEQQEWLLTIYNRYGQIIYSNPNYKNDWDGEEISDGVYFYFLSQRENSFKGWVQVIR